jgi:TonB family protein
MNVKLGCFLFWYWVIAAPAQDRWAVQKLVAGDYPPLAQQARIQGSVELACSVGSEGQIVECTASGHPLLRQAAIANVQQWLFRRQNGSDTDGSQVLLRYEFVLLESTPVRRTKPKVEFSFEFPNHVRIASEIPCADHLPCTPEEFEKFRKQQPSKSKRIIP